MKRYQLHQGKLREHESGEWVQWAEVERLREAPQEAEEAEDVFTGVDSKMKALTVSQPYADLIANGEKWVENRTWGTSYRGLLAIHAGKGSRYLSAANLRDYDTGCVVATCRLMACVSVEVAREDLWRKSVPDDFLRLGWNLGRLREFLDHTYTEGPVGWILSDVQKLAKPIPATGERGLWIWKRKTQ